MIAELASAIEHLLYTHDCVILPGFGGFVGEYQSATIHPVTHTMRPPGKRIRFNEKLIFNDGLLVHEIMRRKSISYNDALEWIQEGVVILKNRLQAGDRIALAKVGQLRTNEEGGIVFMADISAQLSSESYGLAEMRNPAVVRGTYAKSETANVSEAIPMHASSNNPFPWRAAAVLVPAIGLAVSGYLYRSPLAQAGLGVYEALMPSPPSVYRSLPRAVPHYTITWDDAHEDYRARAIENLELEENRSDEVVEPAGSEPAMESFAAVSAASNSVFEIVAGCFAHKENALQLVDRLQNDGFAEARIAGQRPSGLWMVSYASSTSRKEALTLLRAVRESDNESAWLLKN